MWKALQKKNEEAKKKSYKKVNSTKKYKNQALNQDPPVYQDKSEQDAMTFEGGLCAPLSPGYTWKPSALPVINFKYTLPNSTVIYKTDYAVKIMYDTVGTDWNVSSITFKKKLKCRRRNL